MLNDSVIKGKVCYPCSAHYLRKWQHEQRWLAVHRFRHWQLRRDQHLADQLSHTPDSKVQPRCRDTKMWKIVLCRMYDILCYVVKLRCMWLVLWGGVPSVSQFPNYWSRSSFILFLMRKFHVGFSFIFSVGIVVVLVPYLHRLNKSWNLAVGGDFTDRLLSFIQCRYLFYRFPDYIWAHLCFCLNTPIHGAGCLHR